MTRAASRSRSTFGAHRYSVVGPARKGESMSAAFTIEAIGHVECERAEPIDDDWDTYPSIIHLDPERFGPEALQGLESFSHVEILYLFDRVEDAEINIGARHPRGRADWPKIGIFAQRGKGRPNRIGATICRIETVAGTQLRLTGLDAINGTPVIDIKPVMSGFLPRGSFSEPDWATEIMREYWTESGPSG
jgi:tRNA (adenine37-N6)-methyltransferase